MAWKQAGFDKRIASREVFIDPAELLGLIHNNQIQLLMLDVRSESDFNIFHLRDARHVTLSDLEESWPARRVGQRHRRHHVERRTGGHRGLETDLREREHQRLRVGRGINRWLDLYDQHLVNVPGPEVGSEGDDTLRHSFDAAWATAPPWLGRKGNWSPSVPSPAR